jgi:hypothetical protein
MKMNSLEKELEFYKAVIDTLKERRENSVREGRINEFNHLSHEINKYTQEFQRLEAKYHAEQMNRSPNGSITITQWKCEICHQFRDDKDIAVISYPIKGTVGATYNLKFCTINRNDINSCESQARSKGDLEITTGEGVPF